MRRVRLGELATFTSGGTPPRGRTDFYEGDIPWITGADIDEDGSATARSFITPSALMGSSATLVSPGTVLLVTRTSVGKVGAVSVDTAFSQDITGIHPDRTVLDSRYLVHFLRSQKSYFVARGRGATIKGVTREVVAGLPVPVPALFQQRRIAAILDHVDALHTKRRQVLTHLNDLRASVFLEMFGDPRIWPTRWPMGTIGDMAESVQYGSSAKAGASGAFPMLRMGNLTYSGQLDLSVLKFIDLHERDVDRYVVRRGDILFNRTNSADKVGKTAVVQTDRRMAFAGYLIRVRVGPEHKPEFVSAYLNSVHGKTVLRGMAKVIINQANINATEMRSIRIAMPPTDDQQRFVERLRVVEEARSQSESSRSVLDDLSRSIQDQLYD